MDNHLIEIHIPEQFRAIQKADINIDGITVMSGINGCGKSTISKLLYYTYKYSINYDILVVNSINNGLQPYYDILNQLYNSLMIHSRQANRNGFYRWRKFHDIEKAENYLNDLKTLCHSFIETEMELNREGESMLTDRLWRILWTAIGNEGERDLKFNFDVLYSQIEELIKTYVKLAQERPYDMLMDRLSVKMRDDIPPYISISEYGDAFIGPKTQSVALPHYIQKVFYIDTPMMIGLETLFGPDHWDDLNSEVKSFPSSAYVGTINDTILKEILHGEAIYDDESIDDKISFKRDDGKIFDLLDCATGVKSFSILQLLLKNNVLKKDTLLIIDEPEAHLHPQWIVEYARLVLLLHKEIGAKFLIASHSTDMVGSLKELAPTIGVSDLNFYVAEDAGNMQYKYKQLGNDVEPIFASFNKSFEKLDKYAGAANE